MTEPDEWTLVQFVIYERPRDYPTAFVVREWRIGRGGTISRAEHPYAVVTSLEAARACIPEGMVCLQRSDGDEPQIREVWT